MPKIEMKTSPLPDDRKIVCEPLCMEIKDKLLEWVDQGLISMREAADIVQGLHFAFSNMVQIMEAQGQKEFLDILKSPPEW